MTLDAKNLRLEGARGTLTGLHLCPGIVLDARKRTQGCNQAAAALSSLAPMMESEQST